MKLSFIKLYNKKIGRKGTICLIIATAIIFTIIICSLHLEHTDLVRSSLTDPNAVTIVIDAGHGGKDGGASGYDNIPEKVYNLKLAQKLEAFCKMSGLPTIMTRTSDDDTDGNNNGFYKATDIKNRIKLAEQQKNAIFISLHLNSSDSESNQGFQVFYGIKNEKSKSLAEKIQASIQYSGLSTRVREVKASPKTVYIQQNIKTPSVLAEVAFIKNGEDYLLIKNELYQQKMMFALMNGVIQYLQFT